MQQPWPFYLEFQWFAPLGPLMTTSILLGVASDESEDGLSESTLLGVMTSYFFETQNLCPAAMKALPHQRKPLLGKTRSGNLFLALNSTTMSIWMTIIPVLSSAIGILGTQGW